MRFVLFGSVSAGVKHQDSQNSFLAFLNAPTSALDQFDVSVQWPCVQRKAYIGMLAALESCMFEVLFRWDIEGRAKTGRNSQALQLAAFRLPAKSDFYPIQIQTKFLFFSLNITNDIKM